MTRLRIICEGQTEEEFVNELLARHLHAFGVYPIPIVIGTVAQRGGNVKYHRLLNNIRNSLLSERNCYCTTLIDFYGLGMEFPGKSEAKEEKLPKTKAESFCFALQKALERDIGVNPMRRFIPYVQMHEYEALLFSEPTRMAQGFDRLDLKESLAAIRAIFPTPEHINDDQNSAPSKRIIKLFPGYERQKPLFGVLAASTIGLPKIRQECPLFNNWLCALENLPPPAA